MPTTLYLRGAQNREDPNNFRGLDDTTIIDAYDASWAAFDDPDYEFLDLIKIRDTLDTDWKGGVVVGSFPPTVPYDRLIQANAVVLENAPGCSIIDLRIHNTGRAIKLVTGCDNLVLDGLHLSMVRDAAILNSFGCANLIVKNCLVDSCFVLLDSEPIMEGQPDRSAVTETWFDNNLVRLRNMPTGFLGPGHGRFFKMDPATSFIDPKVKLTNNTFRVDSQHNCCGNFMMPTSTRVTTVTGNTMVWGGSGGWPYATETGWTVSTDLTVWENARRLWLEAHAKAALEIPFPVNPNRL